MKCCDSPLLSSLTSPDSGLRGELCLLLVAAGVQPVGARPRPGPAQAQGGLSPQGRRPLDAGRAAGLHHPQEQRGDDVPGSVRRSLHQTLELDTQGDAQGRRLGVQRSASNEGASPPIDGSLRPYGQQRPRLVEK